MLNLKKLLTKILARTNFRIVTGTSEPFNMTAGGTNWVTCPLPTSGKAIAVVGYYINGNPQATIYSINLVASGASFAVKNQGTVQLSNVKIEAHYLVVD